MAAASLQLPIPAARPRVASAVNPEFDLLQACCAHDPQANEDDRIAEAIECGVRWDLLLRMAEHHGVLPLVMQRLAPFCAAIPKEVWATFTRAQQIHSRRSLWLTSELVRIAGRFKQAGIGFLTYKGPALAELLYGDVIMRQFGDLDFLVYRDDVSRAMTAARELGYHSQLALTEAQEQAFISVGYERVFDSQFGRNLLEIKWQVLPPFYAIDFDVEKMFLRSDSINIDGLSVPTLGMEDLLLLLCVHAAKHGWEKLSWLCDIGVLAAHVLDWELIEKQARQLGVQRILAINFVLANRLLQTPMPATIAVYLQKDGRVASLVNAIAAKIEECGSCDVASIAYFKDFSDLREQRMDWVRFWWRLITTPGVGEWNSLGLRNPRSLLYKAVRGWRLARKAVGPR
ncbi:MAG TPA: nucleotidyltransferase family protein [Terriglobales bacterium]|jgi:hypothetical protein